MKVLKPIWAKSPEALWAKSLVLSELLFFFVRYVYELLHKKEISPFHRKKGISPKKAIWKPVGVEIPKRVFSELLLPPCRYVYELFHKKKEISRELLDFCIRECVPQLTEPSSSSSLLSSFELSDTKVYAP